MDMATLGLSREVVAIVLFTMPLGDGFISGLIGRSVMGRLQEPVFAPLPQPCSDGDRGCTAEWQARFPDLPSKNCWRGGGDLPIHGRAADGYV